MKSLLFEHSLVKIVIVSVLFLCPKLFSQERTRETVSLAENEILSSENDAASESNNFRNFLLNKEYKNALALVDKVFEEKKKEGRSELETSLGKYLTVVYLYLVQGLEHELLKKHDTMAKEFLGGFYQDAAHIVLFTKITTLAQAGETDAIISECNRYLKENQTILGKETAYCAAGVCYASQGAYEKARQYFQLAKDYSDHVKLILKTEEKILRARTLDNIEMEILFFYIDNMTEEYKVRFCRNKPNPPYLANEKVRCDYGYSVEVFSTTTGQLFNSREIEKKIQEKSAKTESLR